MNVWLIQIGEALPVKPGIQKMRTGYLAEKFVNRGHDVLWWASAFDHFTKSWLYKDDTEVALHQKLKIKTLKGIGYKGNVSWSRYVDHRIIARKFRRTAPYMAKPDIIVASMPSHDLAYEAVTFGAKNRIPVILDVRDQWPDIFLDRVPVFLRCPLRVALQRDFRMTKEAMKSATAIVSMMNKLLDWGLNHAERERQWTDKLFYLGAEKSIVRSVKKLETLKMGIDANNKFVITFIGTFGEYYNPLILTEVAKRVSDSQIHFILAGDGVFFEEVKRASAGLSNLNLTGWLSSDEMSYILSFSNVGIVSCNKEIHAFPNKAFSYLSAGLPIISSTLGDLKEIIEKQQIGFYYPPKDVDSLASCIKRLYEDPQLYIKISENAQKVFNEMFDANKIYDEYAKHVESVADAYSRTRE